MPLGGWMAATDTKLLLVAVGLVGLFGVVAVWRWPSMGLAVIPLVAFLAPGGFNTGTQSSLDSTLLWVVGLAGLWSLKVLLGKETIRFDSPVARAAICFCLVSVLSFVMGMQPPVVFAQGAPVRTQLGGLTVFLASIAACLLAMHQLRSQRSLAAMTWVFLAAGAGHLMQLLLEYSGVHTGLGIPVAATGSLFWTWLAALPSGQALANRDLPARWRLALGALAFFTLFVGWYGHRTWVSAWLPAATAVGVCAFIVAPARLRVLMVVMAPVAFALARESVFGMVAVEEEYSYATRTEAWAVLLPLVQANPISGLGFANYYWFAQMFPLRGYYVPFSSHNNYMDLLLQVGILGIVALAWLLIEIGKIGWRIKKEARPGFDSGYACGALGGLAGTLVAGALGDWFLPFAYNTGIVGFRASVIGWLFMGGLVAIGLRLPVAERIRARTKVMVAGGLAVQ